MTRSSSRFLAVLALVGVGIVASLVAGVGTVHATTTFRVDLTALIAAGGGDPVPQVSYGGKIGYHLEVQNQDTSNTTHVQVVVDIPTATFFDATDTSCAAAKGKPSEMICTPPGGTLGSGQTYSVNFRFTAPSSGSSVTATPSVSIAAKTNGNPGNNGTTSQSGDPVTVQLNPDGSTNDTYLRKNENASAGGPGAGQTFAAHMPTALLGDPFGLELGIHNESGPSGVACPTCIGSFTSLTIPSASDVSDLGNPFYDGINPNNPYTWTMTATTATSFKLLGIFHIADDGTGTTTPIPACSSLTGGGPTLDDPVCYDTLTAKNQKGVQNLTATGRGLENGKITFG